MSLRLHTRLTLGIGLLLIALAIVLGAAIALIAERYHAEIAQRLNADVAMYVTDELALLDATGVNAPALRELARRVMTVNPSAEVYLLSRDGSVLETLQPRERLARNHIDLRPVRRFLAAPDERPLYGDDPADASGRVVFSVAPINVDDRLVGYLYVIFASERSASIAAAVRGSYSLKAGLIVASAIVLVTFVIAAMLFARLTLPLRNLERDMTCWDRLTNGAPHEDGPPNPTVDEIALLQSRFRSMAARIQSHLEELKLRDSQRRELVVSVSHDLRTPLASLRGYLDTVLIKRDALEPMTHWHYLEIAQRHAHRLGRLIDTLFELSKLESGAVTPSFEAFSLSDLLQDIALRFRLRAQQLGVELTTQLCAGAPLAYGDVSLIERLLENLLDNSLQHTGSGGRIELALVVDDGSLRVTVSDTGTGISPRDLPHVFERFYRGAGQQRSGTGLGLAIVRKIAQLHGAPVTIRTTSGIGTQIEFALHAAASRPPPSIVGQEAPTPRPNMKEAVGG